MDIFGAVKCYLPETLPESRRAELTHILECNAGEVVHNIQSCTHIVTNTYRFEGWQDVPDEGPQIINDIWVDRSLILGKALPCEFYSADPAKIFSGVVACGSGISAIDLPALEMGIIQAGGQWRHGLSKDVTHLFATSRDSDKYATVIASQELTKIKVLLPHWFDDAILLGFGRRLPTALYEWPDPKLLHPPSVDTDAKKAAVRLTEAQRAFFRSANWDPDAGGSFPGPAEPKGEVWGRRRIFLSPTLGLSDDKRRAVEAAVEAAGGIIVRHTSSNGDGNEEEELSRVNECDVLVTRWRSGRAFFKAAKEGKVIGTLAWVFYTHATGVMSSPMDQLLHYPSRKKPIERFSAHRITVTNYTGEAREYIKRLIDVMGAVYTPNMSNANTVLIAANTSGMKTEKALSWSIPIVNQTWLEDCFAQWRNLTPAVTKYTHFPPTFDFTEMLAQKRVTLTMDDLDLEEDEDILARSKEKAPAGTEASVREVEGLLDSGLGDGDVVMGDKATFDRGECLTPVQHSKLALLRESEPRVVPESVSPQKQKTSDRHEDFMDVDESGPSKRPSQKQANAEDTTKRRKQPRRSNETDKVEGSSDAKAKAQVEANGNGKLKGKGKGKAAGTVTFAPEAEKAPVAGPSSTRVVKKPAAASNAKRKASTIKGNEDDTNESDSDSPPPKKRVKAGQVAMQEISAPAEPLKRKMTAGPGRNSVLLRAESLRVVADEQRTSTSAKKGVQKQPVPPAASPRTKKTKRDETADESDETPPRRLQSGRNEETDSSDEIPPPKPLPKPSKSKARAGTKGANASTSSRVSATNVKIMTTKVTLPDHVSKALTKLGVKTTSQISECTHLIAPGIVRTEKFLCALAHGAFLLTEKWAMDTAASSKLLPEENYLIKDLDNERKWDFRLVDAMARAKENREQLFKDMTFYVTSKVSSDMRLLKSVVVYQGGKLVPRAPTHRILDSGPGRYIISCPEDKSVWRPLMKDHAIYSTELVLCAAVTQEIDFDNPAFRVPGST